MEKTPDPPLIHIVYSSASEVEFTSAELLELLRIAREKNAKAAVTGILLYYNRSFFQVLEGPEAAVKSIYEKISKDSRHAKMLKIIEEPVENRAFQSWTMGYANMKIKDLKSIPGLNDFFNRGSYLFN